MFANTKKLNAISPNPTAVSVAASTLSTISTRTFLCSFGGVRVLRSISSSEYPRSRRRLLLSSFLSNISITTPPTLLFVGGDGHILPDDGTTVDIEPDLGRKASVELCSGTMLSTTSIMLAIKSKEDRTILIVFPESSRRIGK